MKKIEHTYSYTAAYEDGTIIQHDCKDPEGDKCLSAEQGSRFTDVLNKGKESKLTSFVLHNDKQTVGVDLRDGHFEFNGVPFWQHRPDLNNYTDFRIIYYRTVRHSMHQQTRETSGEILWYVLGWQVTFEGKNVEKIVLIQ